MTSCACRRRRRRGTFSLADIADGPDAGTYYNQGACSVVPATIVAWTGWEQGVSADVSAKSDLRNALTTGEKTSYTDNQQWTADTATLQAIDPALKWGTALTVSVGTYVATDDVVCLQETSASGNVFSLADIADGPDAGTYYNQGVCSVVPATIVAWTGW